MDYLTEAVELTREKPDELYGEVFRYFQGFKGDISKIVLPSHLPESIYADRAVLGRVITAALMAMLDYRLKAGGSTLDAGVHQNPHSMPTAILEQLDEIVIEQGATIGQGICASDFVLSRSMEWERHDPGKYKRFLRALDKAARIHQRKTPAPLTDPNRREVKNTAVKELRTVLKRLQEEFKARRRQPTTDEILKAFEHEASQPELSFLSNSHNRFLWREFLQSGPSHPLSLLSSSAADLFDRFAAFTSSHTPEYARQKFSSREL